MNSRDNGIGSAKTIAAAATCAALYAIVNILTSPIHTPWGVGEFRPGVVIPAFYALIFGPVPAALGAGVGSVIGDLVSLVPGGASTPIIAIVAGGIGNFLGFIVLGYVYQKIKAWRGFMLGTISGLFVGNLWAAAGVVFLYPLPSIFILGLLLFWFATMFPFVIIVDPILLRALQPYARSISSTASYPELVAPEKKLLWTWTIAVTILVLAALGVFLVASPSFISSGVFGAKLPQAIASARWIEVLLVISAVSVLLVGAFIPTPKQEAQVPIVSSEN